MYVRNLAGEEFAVMATTETIVDLNGNQNIVIQVIDNKVNNHFISDIEKMWEFVDNDETEYKIRFMTVKGVGDTQYKELRAEPLFFDAFDNDRIYKSYNGSMTFVRACDTLFDKTDYNYTFSGTFNAVEWENFGGGESRLETFKRILNRYGAEFRIIGNTIHFTELVGDDTNILYAHRLNASEIEMTEDATGYWTYIEGYGNYDDGDDPFENAKLKRTYRSPLANVIGVRHAPPILDGRVKVVDTLDKALKNTVDESLKLTIDANMRSFRQQGFTEYIPNVGDRVFIQDGRIDLDEEVRVVQTKILRNWKGEIIDFQATLGTDGVVKRRQAKMSTAVKNITDIMGGKTKLPFNVLDNAVIHATKALQNAETELQFPDIGGILAVDKNNPNLVTLFNSAGIGVSKDGGRTFKNAITGEGIVAERILAGTVHGLILQGGEVIGGKFTTTGGSSNIEIENGFLNTFENGERTSRLGGKYHTFYRDNKTIGHIGTDSWTGDPSYRGLVFYADEADFFGWGVKNESTGTYDLALSWHRSNAKRRKGIHSSDDFTAHKDVYIKVITLR